MAEAPAASPIETAPILVGAAGTALCMVALWSGTYLPMVDLPQHAAQLELWHQLADPAVGLSGRYELNWLNPYWLGYGLSRLFMLALPTEAALRATLTLAVLGLPLALGVLLRRQGADPWLALWGFPLAFGFPFYWGFLNFLVSLPLGLLYLAYGLTLARRSRPPGWGLVLATFALFFCHLLTFGFCAGVVAVALLARCRTPREAVRRLLPLVATAPVIAIWARNTEESAGVFHDPVVWRLGLGRLLEWPSLLLSAEGTDLGATAMAGVGLGLVAMVLARRRPRRDWAPLATGALLYLGLPREAFGLDLIYPRFAPLVAALLLAVLPPASSPLRRRLARGVTVLVAIGWLLLLGNRFRAFDREAAAFGEVTASLRPGERLLAVIPDASSEHVPGHPYAHFAAWSQVRQGAEPVFSFTRLPQMLVRERHPAARPPHRWYDPAEAWEEIPGVDAYLLRRPSRADLARAETGSRRVAHRGDWWLFRRDADVGGPSRLFR